MPSHRVLLELTARYTEPHRHYHSIEHIAWLLHVGRELPLTDEQTLGIWFHDAVYDLGSETNEEDSAVLARKLLAAEGYPEASIRIVEQIVLDTKPHVPSIEPSALVVDLDLAPLASPRAEFVANTEKLRRENSHATPEEFNRGRLEFVEQFMARDRIFFTPWGAQFESPARRNLELDLDLLRRG